MASTYQSRDDILLRLGFVSYKAYLDSDLWRSIRERAFRVHGHACKMCGEPTHILHHKNYEWEVLSGKTVKGLVPLCKSCHYKIEFDIRGHKRSLDKVNNLLSWALGGTTSNKCRNKRKRKKRRR
jgi:hypothetical protein